MRSILLFVILTIACGVFVARYADHRIKSDAHPNAHEVTTPGSTSFRTVEAPRRQARSASSYNDSARNDSTQNESSPTKLPEIVRMPTSARSITLVQDRSGHYRTEARVDGTKVDFLVDTGATAVMLSAGTAAKLGIRPARSEYTVKVMTGNGEIKAAVVRLNKIEVGDITVRDVRALVHSDEKLSIDLLGMTFLSEVRWTHDRGKLIIEPRSTH